MNITDVYLEENYHYVKTLCVPNESFDFRIGSMTFKNVVWDLYYTEKVQ